MKAIKVAAIKRRLAMLTPPSGDLPSLEWREAVKRLEGGVGESSAEIKLSIKRGHDGKLTLDVEEGGPTGYESCYLSNGPGDGHIEDLIEKGWRACAGTIGRYDSLFVPGESIQKVVTAFLFLESIK